MLQETGGESFLVDLVRVRILRMPPVKKGFQHWVIHPDSNCP